MGDAFRYPAPVDENKRRSMSLDKSSQPIVDFAPNVARYYGFERRVENHDSEVARPLMPRVDNGGFD
jgi:hypothetical protein